jgi:cobalt-zinc-cadmium efflux system membrane fusion protein
MTRIGNRSNASSPHRAPILNLLLAVMLGAGCGGRVEPAGEKHAVEDQAAETHADEGGAEETPHVELTPQAIRSAGLRSGPAGPAMIAVIVEAPGEVHLNAERVLEVRPRYPGVIRELRKRIGEPVRPGEVLAVVQSNESLTDYEIASSTSGTVISRTVVAGQAADHETVMYVIADLSTVWVDFAVYPQVVGRIRPGMAVTVVAQNRRDLSASGTISYVGPLLEQDTRVSSARVELANTAGRWQPGLFVNARVTLERVRVPIAVPEEAIVRMAEGPVVFRARGGRFEPVPVVIGRTDGATTEIRAGLAAGDTVVTRNAFVLKSELGKGEAGHEH